MAQCSCLENPMNREAWSATVHRVTKSRTWLKWLSAVSQFGRQLCLTLCNPTDCSTPAPCPSPAPRACSNSCPLSCDAIQPSHLLSSPSPPAFILSQHQGLFQRVSPSHQVAKVLELQLQHQSCQWIFKTDFLKDFDVLAIQGTLKSFLQHHSAKASILWHSALWSSSHIHPWLLEKAEW